MAAAVLSFAFLPVAYSRVAVTDVGALAGVALALCGRCGRYEDGRLRHYALAGAAAGLARRFKYTAGLALLPLASRPSRGCATTACGRSAGSRSAARWRRLVFVVLNPYVLGSLDAWWTDLRDQAEVAAGQPKPGGGGRRRLLPGQPHLGARLGRRRWRARRARCSSCGATPVRGLMLVAVPVALFAYLSLQSRYFGRWLLPAYPALAMLAAVALVRAAELAAGWSPAGGARRTAPRFAGALLALSRAGAGPAPGRRRAQRARARPRGHPRAGARFLEERYPPELRVAIEPAVPGRYYRSNPDGPAARVALTLPGAGRLDRARASLRRRGGRGVCEQFKPGPVRPPGRRRAGLGVPPGALLGVIDDYRRYGYCLVMTIDVVRERALETGDPGVRAYYRRLEREARLVREFSPYDGAPSRCRSTSTSPTTTTRPPTSARARRCASTGCATAARATARR